MQRVNIIYVSNAAAFAAAVSVSGAFLTQLINLQIIPDGAGAVPQYYPSCAFSKMKPSVSGCSVEWTMDFTSKMATFTQPM